MKSRNFLLVLAVLTAAAVVLSACPAPQVVEVEKIVKETVEVEKVVRETVVVEVPVETGAMRELSGKLTVGLEGALPVPGAPMTKVQSSWAKALAVYREFQPNVELEVLDLPPGMVGEEWCPAHYAASTMPDIVMVNNCEGGRPRTHEIPDELYPSYNLLPYSDEINPYSGRPWKEDWLDEHSRLFRSNMFMDDYYVWTTFTDQYSGAAIYVNWDILNEYGYEAMPETLTELWELSHKINDDGKYIAWDSDWDMQRAYSQAIGTNLNMDLWQQQGGDITSAETINATHADTYAWPHKVQAFCNGEIGISSNPSMIEMVQQIKDFVDASQGGAIFYDPARDLTGTDWLTGQAAFRYAGTWWYSSVLEAKDAGVFGVQNWTLEWWPPLTEEGLHNKDVEIYFEGERWHAGSPFGDNFMLKAAFRGSGEDPNVDLIARDFIQFLSSPLGQQRVLDRGGIPTNPIAAMMADPALAAVYDLRPAVFEGIRRVPMGNNDRFYEEPGQYLFAYNRGEISLEEAMALTDKSTTIGAVQDLMDNLERYGMDEMYEECLPYTE